MSDMESLDYVHTYVRPQRPRKTKEGHVQFDLFGKVLDDDCGKQNNRGRKAEYRDFYDGPPDIADSANQPNMAPDIGEAARYSSSVNGTPVVKSPDMGRVCKVDVHSTLDFNKLEPKKRYINRPKHRIINVRPLETTGGFNVPHGNNFFITPAKNIGDHGKQKPEKSENKEPTSANSSPEYTAEKNDVNDTDTRITSVSKPISQTPAGTKINRKRRRGQKSDITDVRHSSETSRTDDIKASGNGIVGNFASGSLPSSSTMKPTLPVQENTLMKEVSNTRISDDDIEEIMLEEIKPEKIKPRVLVQENIPRKETTSSCISEEDIEEILLKEIQPRVSVQENIRQKVLTTSITSDEDIEEIKLDEMPCSERLSGTSIKTDSDVEVIILEDEKKGKKKLKATRRSLCEESTDSLNNKHCFCESFNIEFDNLYSPDNSDDDSDQVSDDSDLDSDDSDLDYDDTMAERVKRVASRKRKLFSSLRERISKQRKLISSIRERFSERKLLSSLRERLSRQARQLRSFFSRFYVVTCSCKMRSTVVE